MEFLRSSGTGRTGFGAGAGVILAGALLAFPLVFSGCKSMGPKPGYVVVSSEPEGAEIFVMGEKRGTTPTTLREETVFPASYPKSKQPLYGRIEFRKQGCKTQSEPVTEVAISRGLKVWLDCGPSPTGEKDRTEPVLSDRKKAIQQLETAEVIKLRLRRVQELREQGVISEAEAAEARKRILSEL